MTPKQIGTLIRATRKLQGLRQDELAAASGVGLRFLVELEAIKERARMIKNNLPSILTYFKHRISNAAAEGLNSEIQTVKANTRGYRSFDGFRNSILFYCGGLDMTP